MVASAVGTTKKSGVITGITQANPAVVTSAAHGLVTGERIVIQGVGGMTQVNGNTYVVDVLTSGTFSLNSTTDRSGVNSSGYGAYTAGGSWVMPANKPDMVDIDTDVTLQLNTTATVPAVVTQWNALAVQFKTQLSAMAAMILNLFQLRITDKTTVLDQLPALSAGAVISSVLKELFRDMVTNAQTIKKNTVTVSAVTADAGNVGNGTVLLDQLLDAVNAPLSNSASIVNERAKGLTSELSVSEPMTLTCVVDSGAGALEGEEIFTWEGRERNAGAFDYNTEGSGTSLNVTSLNSSQIISNKDFESWVTNVPVNWTLDAGVAGTDFIQETNAADVYRGTYAAKFQQVALGTTAAFQISQPVSQFNLRGGRRYLLAVRVKGQAGIATGALTIHFESPSGDYTAAGSEEITMNAAALAAATTYTLKYFYITMPVIIPADLELVIKIAGILTASKGVWIDSLAFGPVVYANGINIAIIAGSTPFQSTDRFTFTVTNDKAGVFQEWFRKNYGIQLPSSATPTISDKLTG